MGAQKNNSFTNLFEGVLGQESGIQLLEAALKQQKIHNAYLFCGPNGVGRKLVAIRFLEGLINNNIASEEIRVRLKNRNHPDLLWVEPTYLSQGKLITKSNSAIEKLNIRSSPQIRIDQIKEIKRFLGNKPVEASLGMVVIEDLDEINEAASNALLKALEEPGKGVFILLCERPESLLSTIRSRCQEINFHRLSITSIKKILDSKKNDLKIDLANGINQIELTNLSNGSPGSLIENIQTWENIPIEIWSAIKRLPNTNPIEDLTLSKEITECLNIDQQIWLINWLQEHIWINSTNIKAVRTLERLKSLIKSYVQPRLAWETTLIQLFF